MANILVIDDEPIVLDLIHATLHLAGHTVTALNSPLAIFDCAPELLKAIDLILTDVSMKPISGFEMVKRLNLEGLEPPVLFMSGYSAMAAAIAERLGNHAVIEKPFTVSQLRDAVNKALAGNKQMAGQG